MPDPCSLGSTSSRLENLRVAVVHPWFVSSGGAEATVNVLAEVFPKADFFCLMVDKAHLPPNLHGRTLFARGLQWLPWKYKLYRYFLPLYPLLFESLDLSGYDLVLTSDSCVTKCVLVDQAAVHLCYCYSPMRCLYDQYREFCAGFSALPRFVFILAAHYVRMTDYVASQRVDCLVGDSKHIADRISKYYKRESKIIYPPVDTNSGYISDNTDDYYLSVGRLTAPKRVDLLIEACNLLQRRLVIVGSGREMPRLRKMSGSTIEFRGRVSDEERSKLYARCRAFLFAPNEDFGIVPVEAQAYGRPVIAYGSGGSLETVIDSVTGLFFEKQTPECLAEAILKFESLESTFDPQVIQQNSHRFGGKVFRDAMIGLVDELFEEKTSRFRGLGIYAPNSEV